MVHCQFLASTEYVFALKTVDVLLDVSLRECSNVSVREYTQGTQSKQKQEQNIITQYTCKS